MIKLSDTVGPKGILKIESVDKFGNKSILVNDNNLIVLPGRISIADVLAGKKSASAINDIAFGDGGTLANNSAVVIAIDQEETGVKHRITAKQKVDYTFNIDSQKSGSPKVVISVTIPEVPIGFDPATGEPSSAGLNGKNISEVALMMQDGIAFSIKRFPAIPKSDFISLILDWTIYI